MVLRVCGTAHNPPIHSPLQVENTFTRAIIVACSHFRVFGSWSRTEMSCVPNHSSDLPPSDNYLHQFPPLYNWWCIRTHKNSQTEPHNSFQSKTRRKNICEYIAAHSSSGNLWKRFTVLPKNSPTAFVSVPARLNSQTNMFEVYIVHIGKCSYLSDQNKFLHFH